MTALTARCAESTSPPSDVRKHVRYTHGMVLGVAEFIQDFGYLAHRNRWLAVDAIGYGTCTGLKVERRDGKLAVTTGTALSPRGQLICVGQDQCAVVNDWLARETTRTQLVNRGLGSGASFNTFLVLCYCESQVDDLPIPGEPCRCEGQTTAKSRILDGYRLELRWDPPLQREEDVLPRFIAWIRSIPVSAGSAGAASLDGLAQAIRDAADGFDSPLSSPLEPFSGLPPGSLVLARDRMPDYWRLAYRVWVTELRPRFIARWPESCGDCGCAGSTPPPPPDDPCLLLAEVQIRLALTAPGALPQAADFTIDESRRPLVVSLRFLQEWMLVAGLTP